MSRHETTLLPSYFDDIYAANRDPWAFATSAYEREKYAATLAALPKPRYRNALEVGCSIGVWTKALAARCDRIVAIDVARAALDQAEARCLDEPHVFFHQMQVPFEWPEGRFDLLVLSEVIYYLDRADVVRVAERAAACLEPGADIVLVHWTGETHYPLTGDEAAEAFMAASAGYASPTFAARQKQYRLDGLRVHETPRPAASV